MQNSGLGLIIKYCHFLFCGYLRGNSIKYWKNVYTSYFFSQNCSIVSKIFLSVASFEYICEHLFFELRQNIKNSGLDLSIKYGHFSYHFTMQ